MVSRIDTDVLRQIQTGSARSRAQLAKRLEVSPSTMGNHVDDLLERGLLRECVAETSTSGRPPKVLELNPEAGQFVGIDLDAREIFAACVDFAQRRLRDRVLTIQRKDRAEDVLRKIESAIEDVLDEHRPLLGIGIASPGAIDISSGTSLHYQYIRDWKNIPLARRFGERFGVPIQVENNVRTMALAEQAFGKAKHLDSAICVGNRTGISAGILIHGELFRGPDGLAGEIGNWPVQFSKGKGTTLEKAASLRSLLMKLAKRIREGEPTSLKLYRNRVTWEGLVEAIERDDRLVLKVLSEAAETLGKTLVQMSLLLNPKRIIVCGPLAEIEDAFMTPLQESLKEHFPQVNASLPDVCGSELGPFVGALGAGAMAARHWTLDREVFP
ncbi:N-acetylglucosamine repressor [Bremerella volcania]|uniref:N-acetylglucosamine repressor n=1 Tax=Bremerella volcania TaxID=2527984 RepID=A0A518C856_9BACT|nr:ROK family transcriptional regulator [Bremerella volcania]QDU75399.1 N-acetylglucosamine repressor [Bremerella volcania]